MKNQYEYTINSTEDISRALAEAGRKGYRLSHSNSAFYLRGTAGSEAQVRLENAAQIIRGVAPSDASAN